MKRTGTAVFPLHGGQAPRWLFERMTRLSRAIVAALVEHDGPESILVRLSDPFWFQAFGCLLGFDWHSSGVTTTVCGALRQGLRGTEHELGLLVAGGKGKASRKTPQELVEYSDRFGLDGESLVHASRLSAKVDNNAVQDGYQLYHHTFIATTSGKWAVIQQGMHEVDRTARRYHWLSERVESFVQEPHAAVCCDQQVETLNLVAAESADAQQMMTRLSHETPSQLTARLQQLQHLTLPSRHAIHVQDIDPARLSRIFLHTYEAQASTFEGLLGLPKVGAKTLRALALLSELLAGAPPSWRDPARFAFAHGGKDGIPFPVDRTAYDRTAMILEEAVRRARIGEPDRLQALRRLHAFLTPALTARPS